MSCCTSTTRPTASTADPPGDPVWRMAPGLRKPRLRPASAVSSPGCVQPRLRPASAASGFGCVSPGPPRRKPHLTRNVHGSHPSMHVFSLGRFCASPKPSPRGEDAELCSPDAVEASRPIRRRRSRAASCVISCFQSSMLLHNLSSTFSLGKKVSQRARRSSRVLLRTIATAHPAATPHHTAPRPAVPHHAAPRPAVPHHSAPSSRNPAPRHSPANRPAPQRTPASRPAPQRTQQPQPRTTSLPSQPSRTTPLPGQPAQRRPHSPLRQVFHRLSTEFSTFPSVSHSGFLSPWLS